MPTNSSPLGEWTELGSIKAAQEYLAKKLNDGQARVEAEAEEFANDSVLRVEEMVNRKLNDYIAIERQVVNQHIQDEGLPAIVHQKVNERLDKMKANSFAVNEPVQTEFRLSVHAARFLEIERAKNNRPRTYGELKESIDAMIETEGVLSGDMDVRAIGKTTVENYFLFLRRNSGIVPNQQKKRWGFFKRLVRFLWQSELIDLPKNLDSSQFVFKVALAKIDEYSPAEIKAALSVLPDRLKLYAMLALNCGMLNVDMGNLLKIEVDLKAGRIKRKRVKTSEEKDVPEVDYKLWPATLKLLKQGYSDHATLALTSKTGTKLHEHWIGDDGKEHEKDLIGQQWKKGTVDQKGKKFPDVIPLKAFRSIGSTIIGGHREYGRYTGHYLGHSPKSIADKHYVAHEPRIV